MVSIRDDAIRDGAIWDGAIRECVHLGLCMLGIASTRDCAHLSNCPDTNSTILLEIAEVKPNVANVVVNIFVKCVNCSGSHSSANKDCSRYKQEMKVLKIQTTPKLSFPEACKQL